MSTAALVKETWNLTGDDARRTLGSTGRLVLLKDAIVRLRAGDGTSHARSLAFLGSLVLMQALVAVVGFAIAFGSSGASSVIVDTVRASAPGQAGDLLASAVEQPNRVGRDNRFLSLTLGLVGTLITATLTMGQLERAMNRIYGIEKDRPLVEKYPRAFLLALSSGLAIALAFVVLALGRGIVDHLWVVARWPVGIGLVAAGLAVLFRWAPRRRQPGWAWLAFGAGVSVAGWTLCTVALALAFQLSSTFGRTYGPLAGIVALQFWTFFSALAILFGVAVAAQLEAVRAGVPAQDPAKDKTPELMPSRA